MTILILKFENKDNKVYQFSEQQWSNRRSIIKFKEDDFLQQANQWEQFPWVEKPPLEYRGPKVVYDN